MSNKSQTLSVDQAREYIIEHSPRVPAAESVLLKDALNRVCAKKVVSNIQLPAYDNSAMDGYAFCWNDLSPQEEGRVTLPICGESLAGRPYCGQDLSKGTAVRITTGAWVPTGCDTVIPYEKTKFTDSEVTFDPADIKRGANVRKTGESIDKGDEIIAAGTRINASHIGLLASVGIDRLMVYEPLTVSLICTGDELSEPGSPLTKCGVFNSSAHALMALLTQMGCIVRYEGIIKDDPNMVAMALRQAKESSHLILITGGAADSSADLAHQQAALLGELAPWTVKMRPGHPMRFGKIGIKPIFLLPGNPIASFVTFLEFVRGAIFYIQGQTRDIWPQQYRAIAGQDIKKKKNRAEFMRGTITGFFQSAPVVTPADNQSSSTFLPMTQSDVIMYLAAEDELIPKGEQVQIQLLNTLY